MPTCENCGHIRTWKQMLKTSFTLDPAMICPDCGEKQYETPKSRIRNSLLTFIVLSPLLISIFFDITPILLLSLFPVLFCVVTLLYPFL
ncbi:TIGR04104 family putative zinc finger protein [Virgibacillus saliphilus]|uniref:TIGR04104 family putative zinc finger protein n=1 Tax=Virgibacillus saliphilus TaxID=2831674 RepID=UPI002815027E|nr:TIGR04104 family putative zinc finger protein [Virgibacillus sp. NKC19-3]